MRHIADRVLDCLTWLNYRMCKASLFIHLCSMTAISYIVHGYEFTVTLMYCAGQILDEAIGQNGYAPGGLTSIKMLF